MSVTLALANEYKKNKRYIHVETKVPNSHSHPSFN
jgi:hypothetical protein